jgi:hypothetical protein
VFPLSSEIKLILAALTIISAFAGGWEVQSWYRDSLEKKALEDKLQEASAAITKSNQVNAASEAQSQKMGEALTNFNSNSASIKEAMHHANLAQAAAPGCNNPFTPDFVRWLNASPGSPQGPGTGPR